MHLHLFLSHVSFVASSLYRPITLYVYEESTNDQTFFFVLLICDRVAGSLALLYSQLQLSTLIIIAIFGNAFISQKSFSPYLFCACISSPYLMHSCSVLVWAFSRVYFVPKCIYSHYLLSLFYVSVSLYIYLSLFRSLFIL